MAVDSTAYRPLFGGAISTIFPIRFQDVSNVRQVPDHQGLPETFFLPLRVGVRSAYSLSSQGSDFVRLHLEVFVDPARDESLIIELLDLKMDVADSGSATWFLQDLANEQEAEGTTITEQSAVFDAPGLCYRNMPAVITTAVGQMAVSKGRQGREAQNLVKVYLANIRLKGVGTDVLITAYEPLVINPRSESATAVGAGMAVPAAQSGVMPMVEVFKLAVSSFKVHDWSLFVSSAA